MAQVNKGKKILVWENKQPLKYVEVLINNKLFKTLELLLIHITHKLETQKAMRGLINLNTDKEIEMLDDLEDRGRYVAIPTKSGNYNKDNYKTIDEYKVACSKKVNPKYQQGDTKYGQHQFLNYTRKGLKTVIFVFLNGRSRQAGKKFVFTKEDLEGQWQIILNYMGRLLNVSDGIEGLYTVTGMKVCGPRDLQHGSAYVAVPYQEGFKKIDYIDVYRNYFSKMSSFTLDLKAVSSPNNFIRKQNSFLCTFGGKKGSNSKGIRNKKSQTKKKPQPKSPITLTGNELPLVESKCATKVEDKSAGSSSACSKFESPMKCISEDAPESSEVELFERSSKKLKDANPSTEPERVKTPEKPETPPLPITPSPQKPETPVKEEDEEPKKPPDEPPATITPCPSEKPKPPVTLPGRSPSPPIKRLCLSNGLDNTDRANQNFFSKAITRNLSASPSPLLGRFRSPLSKPLDRKPLKPGAPPSGKPVPGKPPATYLGKASDRASIVSSYSLQNKTIKIACRPKDSPALPRRGCANVCKEHFQKIRKCTDDCLARGKISSFPPRRPLPQKNSDPKPKPPQAGKPTAFKPTEPIEATPLNTTPPKPNQPLRGCSALLLPMQVKPTCVLTQPLEPLLELSSANDKNTPDNQEKEVACDKVERLSASLKSMLKCSVNIQLKNKPEEFVKEVEPDANTIGTTSMKTITSRSDCSGRCKNFVVPLKACRQDCPEENKEQMETCNEHIRKIEEDPTGGPPLTEEDEDLKTTLGTEKKAFDCTSSCVMTDAKNSGSTGQEQCNVLICKNSACDLKGSTKSTSLPKKLIITEQCLPLDELQNVSLLRQSKATEMEDKYEGNSRTKSNFSVNFDATSLNHDWHPIERRLTGYSRLSIDEGLLLKDNVYGQDKPQSLDVDSPGKNLTQVSNDCGESPIGNLKKADVCNPVDQSKLGPKPENDGGNKLANVISGISTKVSNAGTDISVARPSKEFELLCAVCGTKALCSIITGGAFSDEEGHEEDEMDVRMTLCKQCCNRVSQEMVDLMYDEAGALILNGDEYNYTNDDITHYELNTSDLTDVDMPDIVSEECDDYPDYISKQADCMCKSRDLKNSKPTTKGKPSCNPWKTCRNLGYKQNTTKDEGTKRTKTQNQTNKPNHTKRSSNKAINKQPKTCPNLIKSEDLGCFLCESVILLGKHLKKTCGGGLHKPKVQKNGRYSRLSQAIINGEANKNTEVSKNNLANKNYRNSKDNCQCMVTMTKLTADLHKLRLGMIKEEEKSKLQDAKKIANIIEKIKSIQKDCKEITCHGACPYSTCQDTHSYI